MTQKLIPRRRLLKLAPILLALSSVHPLEAEEAALKLDPSQTQVTFTLGASFHTVHGAFNLKSGTINFDPSTGKASGLVVVDATSGRTGNDSRDHKMHKEILESQRFPEITFAPTQIHGKVSAQGDSQVQLDGLFKLHGTEHQVTLAAQVQAGGDHLNVTTHLVIPYIEWGLKNPSSFILRVNDKVEIDIRATGSVAGPGTR